MAGGADAVADRAAAARSGCACPTRSPRGCSTTTCRCSRSSPTSTTGCGGRVQARWPDCDLLPRPLLRPGSWIGGDRDGNPSVDAASLELAVHRHAATALRPLPRRGRPPRRRAVDVDPARPPDARAAGPGRGRRRRRPSAPTSRTGRRCRASTPAWRRPRRASSARCPASTDPTPTCRRTRVLAGQQTRGGAAIGLGREHGPFHLVKGDPCLLPIEIPESEGTRMATETSSRTRCYRCRPLSSSVLGQRRWTLRGADRRLGRRMAGRWAACGVLRPSSIPTSPPTARPPMAVALHHVRAALADLRHEASRP